MSLRNTIGVAMIVLVAVAIGWFVMSAPGNVALLRAHARSLAPMEMCAWVQPWTDKRFEMTGWSEPEKWWYPPHNQVLWSNARSMRIVFRVAATGTAAPITIAIRYPGIAAPAEVRINGQHVGWLDAGPRVGNTPHTFAHDLPRAPADGVVDLEFVVRNAPMHFDDGRYLGVLLDAIQACPAGSTRGPSGAATEHGAVTEPVASASPSTHRLEAD